MEYLRNKRNGEIYAVVGYGYWQGSEHMTLKRKGQKRNLQLKVSTIKQSMEWYKPGFFEKIKLFFAFYN